MPPPAPQQGSLDQFLQPQSMVTPGALGAIAMMGTNAIAGNFAYMSLPFTALLLSGLFGLAALVKSTSIPEKVLYYVLNTIIIFSVATGSNKIGQQVQQHLTLLSPSLTAYAASSFDMNARGPERVQFFKEWFSNQPKGAPITVPTSRAAWQQTFMLDVRSGTYNVVVSSLGDSLDKAQHRLVDLCDRFPKVAFRLWSTIAPNGGNPQYAIVIGYGLNQQSALFVADQARKVGIAQDAYITLQPWDVDSVTGELCH
jgi:hypothetical protein